MKSFIYDIVFNEMSASEMFVYEMSASEMSVYEMSASEMSVYEMSVYEMFQWANFLTRNPQEKTNTGSVESLIYVAYFKRTLRICSCEEDINLNPR